MITQDGNSIYFDYIAEDGTRIIGVHAFMRVPGAKPLTCDFCHAILVGEVSYRLWAHKYACQNEACVKALEAY